MSTEEAVQAFYRDRLTNDRELLRGWFTPRARISLNGSGAAQNEDPDVAARRRAAEDPIAVDNLCDALVAKWRWHDMEVLSVLIDGDRAATRVLVDIEFKPTGRRARMEFADFLVFDGHRLTEMIAFLDTAVSMSIFSEDPALNDG